jgi:hypothetical protein
MVSVSLTIRRYSTQSENYNMEHTERQARRREKARRSANDIGRVGYSYSSIHPSKNHWNDDVQHSNQDENQAIFTPIGDLQHHQQP